MVMVVCGWSTLMQPDAPRWTQYQNVELPVEAFHASEMLVAVVPVMRRFVGVDGDPPADGGGCFAGAGETTTSASASTLAPKAMRRFLMPAPSLSRSCLPGTTRLGRDRF